MSAPIRASVVIATRNRPARLKECLDFKIAAAAENEHGHDDDAQRRRPGARLLASSSIRVHPVVSDLRDLGPVGYFLVFGRRGDPLR